MPRVPVYDSPKVLPESLQAPMQREPEGLTFQMERQQQFNQQVDKGLSEGAHALQMMQIEQDETDATAAHGQYISATKGILYGTQNDDGTPGQPGFLSQHGQNAVDAAPATNKALDDARDQIVQGLKTQRAKDLFLRAAGQTQRAVAGQVAEHVLNSQEQAFNNASQFREKVAGNSMAPAFNPVAGADNTAYENFRATAEAEATARAQRAGLPADAVDDFVKLQMTPYYAGVVKHLADNKQGAAAGAFLKEYGDRIANTELRDQLQKLVDTSTSQSSAIHLAASLGQEFPGNFKAQYSKLEKLADSDQIDPETLRLARSEIGSRHAEWQAGRSEYEDALFGRAREIANRGGNITQMSSSDLSYLRQNGSLGVRVDALFKPDGERVDDAALFNELIRQSSEDPAAFLRTNVATMAGQLSKAHLDYVIKLQGTINRKDAKGVEINNVMNGAVKYAWQNINAANINLRAKPNTAAAERAEQFTTTLHDALIAAQEANGDKPLTREQARDITLGLLKEEALSGSGYFGDSFGVKKRRVFEMTPEERAAPWTIPATDRNEIIAALKRQKQPVTEANIQAVFKMQHGVR